ncbi:hypothetical protein GCM10020229_55780 [Kitasatospora albolonga]|uniref:hypothetical protein n=1 Tax=Kitasatospora albolonga TaxID=68173 RepID=UPI0031ED17E6
MPRSHTRLRRAAATLAALPLLALGAGQALAAPAPLPVPASAGHSASRVAAIEDGVARTLASALADPAVRERVRAATATTDAPAALAPLAAAAAGPAARGLAEATAKADEHRLGEGPGRRPRPAAAGPAGRPLDARRAGRGGRAAGGDRP